VTEMDAGIQKVFISRLVHFSRLKKLKRKLFHKYKIH